MRSWVESAEGHPDFPLENLPIGVFTLDGGAPRAGIAIGDMVLDLGLAGIDVEAPLNAFLARGGDARRALRAQVTALLAAEAPPRPEWLHAYADCAMQLPARIGDYTDFFAGIHHAEKTGRLFRPDSPLLPNYRHVPVGYHGRASSVVASGSAFHRPQGQRLPKGANAPVFGPSERLDYELELGIWIGPGNAMGSPVPIGEAAAHIAGYCLLNDWSARDIQAWEYQPLGPFLGKSFCTTISPWVVMPEALEPFRAAMPPRDPAPLPHLFDTADQAQGALALELGAFLTTPAMRDAGLAPYRLAASDARHLYWTPAQMLAHHTSNGCPLHPGDLLGTGTISGPGDDECGSLLEATLGGVRPLHLPNGEERRFLEDGDEIRLTAHARREGFVSIGFGECVGRVVTATA